LVLIGLQQIVATVVAMFAERREASVLFLGDE
jgi:hypothetical protein